MSFRTSDVQRVFAALAVCLLLISSASAQSVTFNFEDGTDQGFGNKFSNDASAAFPIVNIGGSQRMEVLRNGDFQEADRQQLNGTEPFFLAMQAAAANEAGYILSYDWYVDTTVNPGQHGNFFQVGTYLNTGSGYYAQNFPGTGKEVELNGAQLAAAAVYQGTVSFTLASKGFDMPAADNFFRLGFIINGDGAQAKLHLDNITLAPVPEPTSLALLGLGGLGLMGVAIRRRRR